MTWFADPDYDPNAELQAEAPELAGPTLRGPADPSRVSDMPQSIRAAHYGYNAAEQATQVGADQPSAGGDFFRRWVAPVVGAMDPRMAAGLQLHDTYSQRQKLSKKQQEEKVREQIIGEQTQSITGLLNAAMLSDPGTAASVVKAISSIKGLEPETVERVHAAQIKAGLAIRETQQKSQADDEALEAIAKLDPNTRDFAHAAIKASAGSLGASGFLGMLKAGVFGQPRERYNTSQGLAEAHPTGPMAAAQGFTGPNGVTMLTGARTESARAPTALEAAIFVASKGTEKGISSTTKPQVIADALELIRENRQEFTDEALRQRMGLANAAASTRATVAASMQAQGALAELYNAETVINTLTDLSTQLFTATTEPQAFIQGTKYTSQSYVPGAGQPYKRYLETIDAFKVLMGKTQFGHTGVQTEKDAQSTAKAFADPFSTVETVAFKNTMMQQLTALKKYQLTEIAEGRRVDMAEVQRRSSAITRQLTVGVERMKQMPSGFAFVPGSVDIIYQKSNPQNTQRWKDK